MTSTPSPLVKTRHPSTTTDTVYRRPAGMRTRLCHAVPVLPVRECPSTCWETLTQTTWMTLRRCRAVRVHRWTQDALHIENKDVLCRRSFPRRQRHQLTRLPVALLAPRLNRRSPRRSNSTAWTEPWALYSAPRGSWFGSGRRWSFRTNQTLRYRPICNHQTSRSIERPSRSRSDLSTKVRCRILAAPGCSWSRPWTIFGFLAARRPTCLRQSSRKTRYWSRRPQPRLHQGHRRHRLLVDGRTRRHGSLLLWSTSWRSTQLMPRTCVSSVPGCLSSTTTEQPSRLVYALYWTTATHCATAACWFWHWLLKSSEVLPISGSDSSYAV